MSHIIRLQAENLKKLRVLDIRPAVAAGVVPIRGRNAQGKSSTLDAIQAALGGRRAMPGRPVRAGEDEGAIRLELDNGTVILRRFTNDGAGDTLEVTNGEGFKAGSPQKLLDALFASVAFDPLAFTREKPADQLATLRRLVTLDVDVDALERANKADYEARRDKNRERDREAARLEQMPSFADAGEAKVDEAALEATIASAAEGNALIERRKASRERFAEAIETNKSKLATARAELADLQRTIEHFKGVIAEQEQQLANAEPIPESVDVTQAQADLREARETNRRVDANQVRRAQALLVERLGTESDDLTTRMDDRKTAIAASISRAAMPVPGLGFGDGEVLFNDVPLAQASSAEQLRVSTAIGIASSPKLRVMLVRDGSLLDDEGQAILAELALANDFQLWVEAVDASGKVGIVLEDGAVASIDGEPAPEPEAIPSPRRRAKKPEGGGAAETPVGPVDGQGEEVSSPAASSPALAGDGGAGMDTCGYVDTADEQPPFVPDPPKPAATRAPVTSLFD